MTACDKGRTPVEVTRNTTVMNHKPSCENAYEEMAKYPPSSFENSQAWQTNGCPKGVQQTAFTKYTTCKWSKNSGYYKEVTYGIQCKRVEFVREESVDEVGRGIASSGTKNISVGMTPHGKYSFWDADGHQLEDGVFENGSFVRQKIYKK
jgi:hypothetical protein